MSKNGVKRIKKYISILLCVVLAFSCIPVDGITDLKAKADTPSEMATSSDAILDEDGALTDGQVEDEEYVLASDADAIMPLGVGTKEIWTAADLMNIPNDIQAGTKDFILMNDIDFGGLDILPIQSSEEMNFDGNGHEIKNYVITRPYRYRESGCCYALFYAANSIKNLRVSGATTSFSIGDDVYYMGSLLVGSNKNTIDNCDVSGEIEVDTPFSRVCCDLYIGMVAASIRYDLKNSKSHGNIRVGSDVAYGVGYASYIGYIGGLAGEVVFEMSECTNFAEIYVGRTGVGSKIAGLCAQNYSSTSITENCANYGNITALGGAYISGICNGGYSTSKCINHGDIISRGQNTSGITYRVDCISKCVNYGDISIDSIHYTNSASGVVGHSGTITECGNEGNITVTKEIAGSISSDHFWVRADAAGVSCKFTNISNCYNTGNISVSVDNTTNSPWEIDAYAAGIALNGRDYPNDPCDLNYCFNYGYSECTVIIPDIIHAGWECEYGDSGIAELSNSDDCNNNYYMNGHYYSTTVKEYDGTPGQTTTNTIGTPINDSQFKNQSTFTGFDFNTIWAMGEDHPVFQWSDDVIVVPNPEVKLLSTVPSNGAAGVGISDNVELTFDQNIFDYTGLMNAVSIGGKTLAIKDYDTNATVWKMDNSTSVLINNYELKIYNALVNCKPGCKYFLYIDGDMIKSADGSASYGGTGTKDVCAFTMAGTDNSILVRFDSDGGSEVDAQRITAGDSVLRPANPQKRNYSFDGWYTDKTYTTEYDFGAFVYSPITIYAKWTYIGSGGGSGSSSGSASGNYSNNYSDDWRIGDDGHWVCYKDGKVVTGYQTGLYFNGYKGNYYFDSNGKLCTGWIDGKYFNELKNGTQGAEITNEFVANGLNNKKASDVLSGYDFDTTWVGLIDKDKGTQIEYAIVNGSKAFDSVLSSIANLFKGSNQGFGKSYMELNSPYKKLLNEMIKNKLGVEKLYTSKTKDSSKLAGIATKTISKTLDEAIGKAIDWQYVDAEYGNELIEAGFGADNLVSIWKTIMSESEEIQKMTTDYSDGIDYLESLKQVTPGNTELNRAIDLLEKEYTDKYSLGAFKIASSSYQLYDKMANAKPDSGLSSGDIAGIYDTVIDVYYGNKEASDLVMKILDATNGTQFNMMYTLIDHKIGQFTEVKATDTIIYTSALRCDALAALKKAEEAMTDGNPTQEDFKNYANAFDLVKQSTIDEYEAMQLYLSSDLADKEVAGGYADALYKEKLKLENMTFYDYATQDATDIK